MEEKNKDEKQNFELSRRFITHVSAFGYIVPFLPVLLCHREPFAMYHQNQILVLWILATILYLAVGFIPVFNLFMMPMVVFAHLFYVIIGFAFGIRGKAKPLPLIGRIKIIKIDKNNKNA